MELLAFAHFDQERVLVAVEFPHTTGELAVGDGGDNLRTLLVTADQGTAVSHDDILVADLVVAEQDLGQIEAGLGGLPGGIGEGHADEAPRHAEQLVAFQSDQLVTVRADAVGENVARLDRARVVLERDGTFTANQTGGHGEDGILRAVQFLGCLHDTGDGIPASWRRLDGESKLAVRLAREVIEVGGTEFDDGGRMFAVFVGHEAAPVVEGVLASGQDQVAHAVEHGRVGEPVGDVVALHEVAGHGDGPPSRQHVLADATVEDQLEQALHRVVLGTVDLVQEQDALLVMGLELNRTNPALLLIFDLGQLFVDAAGGPVAGRQLGGRAVDSPLILSCRKAANVRCLDLAAAEVDQPHGQPLPFLLH